MRAGDSAPAKDSATRSARPHGSAQNGGGDQEALRPVRDYLGYVPNLFRAQTLLPEILAAEAVAMQTLLLEDYALLSLHKAAIQLAVSSALGNVSCTDLSY